MAGLKERLIQFVLRGKDELSPEAKKSAEALAAVSAEAEQLGKALDAAKEAQGLGRALEQTGRAVTQAQRNLADAEQQVTDLRDALSKTPDAAGLSQSLKQAEREASRSRRQCRASLTFADAVRYPSGAAARPDRPGRPLWARLGPQVAHPKPPTAMRRAAHPFFEISDGLDFG